MITININNSTVTISTNGEKVEVKTDNRATKDKGPFENKCSEEPMPEKATPNSSLAASFIPISDSTMNSAIMGMYRDLFNKTRQDMQKSYQSQATSVQLQGYLPPPNISHFYRPYPLQQPYLQIPFQQTNTFMGYPANPNYHPPHYPVEHEPKGKSTGGTDEMLLPTLRSIPQSKIGYTTSDRPWGIKDIVDTEMNTQTISLQDIQMAMVSATFWVKGYNEYTHKYAYNSWTKTQPDHWVVNATIYESFTGSMPSNPQRMQVPNMYQPI